MKIATNFPSLRAVSPTRPGAAPAPALDHVSGSIVLGNIFPLKLPGGGMFTAADAMALGLGPNFKLPGPTIARPTPARQTPLRGASAGYFVSPHLAAQRSGNPKMVEGVKSLTTLIAANCGPRLKLAHDSIWFGHDCIVFYCGLKDPELKQSERAINLAELGSSAFGVLSGIFHQPWMEHGATALHVTAMIGNHVYTPTLEFRQSEVLELSSAPGAEEAAQIFAVTESFLPSS
jgi:hypothetical protein